MDAALIGGVVGVVISFLLDYVGPVKRWYEPLDNNTKKLVALGIGFVVVLGAFLLGCIGWQVADFACTVAGGKEAILAFIGYALANQTTYSLRN